MSGAGPPERPRPRPEDPCATSETLTMPFPPFDASPLSEEELDELDAFLMEDRGDDDGMMLDAVDGYLHAVAIGPTTLMPSQWLPGIWGRADAQGMMPSGASLAQVNRILELVLRHYNSILADLEGMPREVMPRWSIRLFQGHEYDDAENWAWGFVQGVNLCRADWQPLLDTEVGRGWFRAIGLLGEDDYGPEQYVLTRTPAQRADLALEIPEAVLRMHAHWLPHRRHIHEEAVARGRRQRVGRNDACPCGSGRKHKRCCGAAADA
jgi:uncharacterized protein